jgi:hypothetical protein
MEPGADDVLRLIESGVSAVTGRRRHLANAPFTEASAPPSAIHMQSHGYYCHYVGISFSLKGVWG